MPNPETDGYAAESPASVRFEALEKRYPSGLALSNVTFGVRPGSTLALLGPNGAGKSTLFGCLLGLIRPSGGRIFFRDRPLAPLDRRRFGYVAERIALYPHRTVRENALFFARLRGQSAAEAQRQLQRVGLDAVPDRLVRQLSKGMLQRLGLAIALCGQPELLVLDEPFNGLDPVLLDGLQDILREEQKRGATLLISTHTISAVEPLATDVAILFQGRLVVTGQLQALRAAYPDQQSLEGIYHLIARRANEAPARIASLL